MLASIRSALFNKALRRLLESQKRARKTHTFESARTIGLLFDATNIKHKQEALDISKSLEKSGKKVQLLAYLDVKELPSDLGFEAFSHKELTWTGVPKSPKAEAFASARHDLLLSLNPDATPAVEWIAIQSNAAMKIGMARQAVNDYDLQIEIPQDKGSRFFMDQLHFYLDKIVLKHEPSKAS